MQHTKQFLSSEEIRPLAERSDLMGALLLLHCWGVIIAAAALVIWLPNPLTFLLAVLAIGSRQLGLAILMHEAAHNALFKSRWANEFFGEWFAAKPILADLWAYRRYHLKHHRHTQTDEDPDLALSAPFPTTRSSLRRKILRDITGRTGLKQRAQQFAFWLQMAGDAEPEDMQSEKLSQNMNGPGFGASLAVNLGAWAVLALLGYWWVYPVLWLLPLLTWYQLVLRVRNIAEHGAVERSENPLQNTCTTYADPITAFFIAPYWVNYHLEHHLVMHAPCWRLPQIHRLMIQKGHAPAMRIGRSYWEVLRVASAKPEPQAG